EYIGGYDDWIRQGGKWTEADEPEAPIKASVPVVEAPKANAPASAPKIKKLSYKLQKEFEDLPKKIEQLEQQINATKTIVGATDFYSQPAKIVEEKLQALAQLEMDLEICFERWAELENMQQSD
ncbi:MAG: ABC transporter ATP-binding protein, partial [Moraxellaceae bacterium]